MVQRELHERFDIRGGREVRSEQSQRSHLRTREYVHNVGTELMRARRPEVAGPQM